MRTSGRVFDGLAAAMRATAASARCSSRATTARTAPRRASSSAAASPIPAVAPVTITRLPATPAHFCSLMSASGVWQSGSRVCPDGVTPASPRVRAASRRTPEPGPATTLAPSIAADTPEVTRVRAVVIREHGGPEVLEVGDVPEPVAGPGKLVVEVAAVGVNYRDVYEREGAGMYAGPTPLVAGVEGAGTVREVGDGVADLAVGDRVAWWSAPGSYAEIVAVDAAQAVAVPEGVTDEQAAAVLLQGMTAHYLCMDTYPVRPGEAVVVHAAAGGVGLLLTQMVKAAGGTRDRDRVDG